MQSPIANSPDLRAVQRSWLQFQRAAPALRPIRSETDYDDAVSFMNALIDTVGDDETHPLAGLLSLMGEVVSDYDHEHFKVAPGEPHEVLRFLLNQHGLRQADLNDILPQSNLSAILNSQRKISTTVAKKLARRFSVDFSVFL